jgi:hypothetical protein
VRTLPALEKPFVSTCFGQSVTKSHRQRNHKIRNVARRSC